MPEILDESTRLRPLLNRALPSRRHEHRTLRVRRDLFCVTVTDRCRPKVMPRRTPRPRATMTCSAPHFALSVKDAASRSPPSSIRGARLRGPADRCWASATMGSSLAPSPVAASKEKSSTAAEEIMSRAANETRGDPADRAGRDDHGNRERTPLHALLEIGVSNDEAWDVGPRVRRNGPHFRCARRPRRTGARSSALGLKIRQSRFSHRSMEAPYERGKRAPRPTRGPREEIHEPEIHEPEIRAAIDRAISHDAPSTIEMSTGRDLRPGPEPEAPSLHRRRRSHCRVTAPHRLAPLVRRDDHRSATRVRAQGQMAGGFRNRALARHGPRIHEAGSSLRRSSR